MLKNLISLIKDDAGASLVEYSLLVALVGVAALVGINAVGAKVLGTLNTAAAAMP
jgi:Flp pilus assembly pilin Flp